MVHFALCKSTHNDQRSKNHAFATLWVLPRLHLFRQAHPDIDLRLVASERNMGPIPDSTDLVVRYCNAGSADVHGYPLVWSTYSRCVAPHFKRNMPCAKVRIWPVCLCWS